MQEKGATPRASEDREQQGASLLDGGNAKRCDHGHVGKQFGGLLFFCFVLFCFYKTEHPLAR